jgi:hypothetical protein
MRYRKLDANGDMMFGHGLQDFHVNVPEAPAQAVLTRLKFWTGEWFLDPLDGTDWQTQVLGKHTEKTRDPLVIYRTSGTPGVRSILDYSSSLDRNTRDFRVNVTIDTIYGLATLSESI